ncbi:ras association domain-containing protein 2 [Trichechus manatus latirostris]|uniref:Ras association domain-containing protein 2 n=1 Tax=Trichechus manatus latirostris TaxID=127582 RepID=A0A2Y9RIE1_TRIMA|nr:ras association domain-containing protein 2 [Trichechus manatus latirostris]
MDYSSQTALVPCGQDKYISKNELLLHLKTYNLYYEGQNLQLRHREEEDEFIVEGLLNISWGLRRPIRLQMQDDNERIRPPPSSSSWHSGCNLGAQGTILKPLTIPNIQISDADEPPESDQTLSPTGSYARGWRGTFGLGLCEDRCVKYCEIFFEKTKFTWFKIQKVLTRKNSKSLTSFTHHWVSRVPPSQDTLCKYMQIHTNVSFFLKNEILLCFTSVFTPAYGSVTNVRINSTMTTPQVLKLLLNKFKIENSPEEFALYVVHTSGEKQKLKNTDYPLIARILQGPCEQVSKVFLMEKDQVEEVTYDVAQYIKFEMPVLKSFIQKLQEEEDREVKKLMRKYTVLRLMIRQRLEEIAETPETM